MLRLIGGAVAGLIAWMVFVTILNLGLRYGWPGYGLVEKAMTFTLAMLLLRLAISWVSSLAAGFVAALVDKQRSGPLLSGVLLLLLFVPVHYRLWGHFPLWYHLCFLVSLPLLGWAGGKLQRTVVPA